MEDALEKETVGTVAALAAELFAEGSTNEVAVRVGNANDRQVLSVSKRTSRNSRTTGILTRSKSTWRTGDFVREYMRHLLPHASFIGEQAANSLQKAIVNAMTMDHGQTATDFVREFILERNPMRVGELRESIQTYRKINETIRKMRGKLEALKALREILAALEDAYERRHRERWIAKRAEWLVSRAANRTIREKYRVECEARDVAKKEMNFLDDDIIAAIETEIERLNVAIVEHDTKTGRHAQHEASRLAAETAARVGADFDRRMGVVRSLQSIRGMKGPVFDKHVPAVQDILFLAKGAGIDRMPARLAEADAKLAQIGPDLLTQVDDARQKLFRDAAEHKEKRDAIRERIRQHAAGYGNVHLGRSTEDLCRKLRQAGMAPRMLCNLVEVARPEWTAAAEGLLGRDREAIFVDRSHVQQATAIFKEGRRKSRFLLCPLVLKQPISPSSPSRSRAIRVFAGPAHRHTEV